MEVAPGDGVKEGVLLQGVVSSHFFTANPLGRILRLKRDNKNQLINPPMFPVYNTCTQTQRFDLPEVA